MHRFYPAEIALWQVFSVLIGLQMLAELGFGSTFARLVAYAMGGAADLNGSGGLGQEHGTKNPNWLLLGRICGTMRFIYDRLSIFLAALLVVGGTLALFRRVEALDDGSSLLVESGRHLTTPVEAWLAWGCIVFSTVIYFRNNCYGAFLQGTNHVALSRRWESAYGFLSILTSFATLILGGGLLGLVLVTQLWVLLSAWQGHRLARMVFGGRFRAFPPAAFDREIFAFAWSPAWRAGLGAFMSFGLVQISGLLYAQSEDTVAVASYLLGLRLVQTISQISQAPFYSKLPMLSRLWAQQKVGEQVALAQRGMSWAYWSFVIPFILLGLIAPALLDFIGSQTPFPDPTLWGLLGAAFLCERYGAMHLQLYSTTNHIVWHIANGVTGFIFVAVSLWLFPEMGVAALPMGMLIGNLTFYCWYSARLSHCKFALQWPSFDTHAVGWPALCLGIYLLYVFQS
ncbi:lipopolysaccharide biosynthesis protein [Lacunisphaera limnophila]|nr:hypothetical protein [Lacunisphaera limnophila]